jgi:hypothetical protein
VKNIYQRVNEVRKAVDYLIKDKKVESYMAVTHDAVTAAVRGHFVEQGVMIVPAQVVQSAVVLTGTMTSRSTPFIRFEVRYRFEVVNVDEPNDKFSIEIEAHALDHGDKAPGKALSYAKKYAMLKLLEIETGEEDEGRQEQHKPKGAVGVVAGLVEELKISPKQRNMILDLHTAVVDLLIEDNDFEAFNKIETAGLDNEEKIHLWSMLDSKQRSRLKAQGQKAK